MLRFVYDKKGYLERGKIPTHLHKKDRKHKEEG